MKGGTRVERQEKIDILRQGIAGRHLCMLDTVPEEAPEYIYPLLVSDRFVLYQQEDNFLLDGYAVRRLAQVRTVRLRSGKYEEINCLHGIADGVWQNDLWEIPYSTITKVTWGDRYSLNWQRYLRTEA